MKTTGYKESLEQYKDLVDKKGFSDDLGDAFSRVGSSPAQGASQRMSNAILSGLGSGVSGAAADERKEMLSPYLEQAGRITAKAAELEAQMQQAQSYQLAINEFGQKYTPLVAEFAAAVNSNDPRATMMFKDLVNKAQMIPGFENLEGDSWNPSGGFGLALNTQTGEYRKITADEIVSAVAPAAQTIYGDQWFEKFMPLNAGFAKDAAYAFNMKRQEDALGLEGKRADISNKYSQAGVHNAQAGLYNKQGQELDYKMSPEYLESERQKKSLDYRSDHNAKHYIPEISQKYQKNNEVLTSIDNFKKILNDTSLTGGSFGKRIARFVAEQTGNDEKILEAKNAGQFYFEWMNENSKGALSDRDIKLYTGTFADPEKNRTASINILNKLENKLKGQNTIYRKQLELYDKDPTANLHNLDLIQAPSNTNEVVTMAAPNGSTRSVPAAQVEYWKSKGAKVVDEQK
jgi:hypothetical protein